MEIIEYGSPAILELSISDADAIRDASASWKLNLKLKKDPFSLSKLSHDKYGFRAIGVAGFIRVGRINLEIAPKFLNNESTGPGWRTAMWRFLAYGRGVESIGQASGHFQNGTGIADILADMFLSSLKGASIRGYPLGYKPIRCDSFFAKGVLDPRKYSKLLPATGKVGVISTQLTNDIAPNQLLKWAGLELARSVESSERRKKLNLWLSDLAGVSHIPPPSEMVKFSCRQYPHLTQAMNIARLLYEDRVVGYGKGELNLPGFLWDSDDLFERAVRRLFSEASRPLGFSVSKERYPLADSVDTSMITIPDVDLKLGGRTVFLADAKYKLLGKNPKNEDFYQVLAGGRVKGVSKVSLVYPKSGSGISSKLYKPKGVGNPSEVIVVQIGLESFSTRNDIRRLRADMTSWIIKTIQLPEQKIAPLPAN